MARKPDVQHLGAAEVAEMREFYWYTDVRAAEISEAYGVPVHLIPGVVGPIETGFSCEWCEGPIEVASRSATDWINPNHRFGTRHPGKCRTCEKAFARWRSTELSQQHERAAAELEQLRTMPYRDYLQTQHWQEVRSAALKRAGSRCQICNTSQAILDVHHRTYERRGEEFARDVVVLCRECHARHHGVVAKFAGGRA